MDLCWWSPVLTVESPGELKEKKSWLLDPTQRICSYTASLVREGAPPVTASEAAGRDLLYK